jgi:HD-GYP domain-containing protein (c-di-GMP phosphodiesterase class II)
VIPDDTLLKPGSLTNDELGIMKNHYQIGYHILGDEQAGQHLILG